MTMLTRKALILSLAFSAYACSDATNAEKAWQSQTNSSPSTGSTAVATPSGSVSLTQPTLTIEDPGAAIVTAQLNQGGQSFASQTEAYAPGQSLELDSVPAGAYTLLILVSDATGVLLSGSTSVIITSGQTATASVALNPVTASGKGGLVVNIIPPGGAEQTVCDLYNTLSNEPMAELCEVGTFTCSYTPPNGSALASGPQSCGEIYARLNLLNMVCQSQPSLTQNQFNANFQCSDEITPDVATAVATPANAKTSLSTPTVAAD